MARARYFLGAAASAVVLPDTGITAQVLELEADANISDGTIWAEAVATPGVTGVINYGARFEGYVTGLPALPGGATVGTPGTFSVTWTTGKSATWTYGAGNEDTTGAYVDEWTLEGDVETGHVTISGHVSCQGAPTLA